MIKNKKAQGLSLTTIIIALLVMLVLVVLALIFSGAMGDFAERIREFFATKTCVGDPPKGVGGYEKPADEGCGEGGKQYIGFVDIEKEGHICCVSISD